MKSERTYLLYSRYINPYLASMLRLLNFNRKFVRAQGVKVIDEQGNVYLDFLGAYGAINFGHNHPQIINAVRDVEQLPNLIQTNLNPYAAALAHNLSHVTPGNLQISFFCNSGAESVEGALKLARAATGKHRIIYCYGSFHGKSAGALSVTGREKYRKVFEPLLPHTVGIPFNDVDALERELSQDDVAAFIVEPIQGEGGVIVPDGGYLREVRELCTAYGALLILDEVQTGLGRTGYNFACEKESVSPDILCLAKSLGGGLYPIGAYISTEKTWQRAYGSFDKALLHTSTFGGNTGACAAGIAAIDVLVTSRLAQQAAEKGQYLLDKLRELQENCGLIKEIRGQGLLVGVEFKHARGLAKPIQEYIGALVASHLLNNEHIITAYTLNNPNVIRLEPPLTVSYEEIDCVVSSLRSVLIQNKSFTRLTVNGAKTLLGKLWKRS